MPNTDLTRRLHDQTFERPTTDTHEFRLQPFRGVVLEVDDEHFHHDSAVLLPNYPADAREEAGGPSLGLSVLAECLKHQSANPSMKVLIVGHADTSGPDQYNLGISAKRSKAVLHAILGERDEWVKICEGQHKTEDYQLILTWVANVYGWNCDPEGVDNVNGPKTQSAVKNFQKAYNAEFEKHIGEDGTVGRETWGAFFDVYMDMVANLCETDDAGLAQLRAKMSFIGPKVVGCGENWPIEEPQRPNFRSRINRRVEILFFNPGQEPKLDCHPGKDKCTPLLCEIYNLKMYKFNPLPVNPSPPRPRHCFLKLAYTGPDDKKEFVFPPDFPATVIYKDGSKHVEKVGKDGVLQFGVPQSMGPFTLAFDTPDTFIATAPDGSADAKPNRTAKPAELKDLHKDNFRFFRVPEAWTLKQSDWAPDSAPHYDKDNFVFNLPTGRFGKTLGSSTAPEKLKLDPHWTYLRFEFFDRYFGHSDHNHKRINIPATLIDGWRTASPAARPDTSSHWTVRDTDNDKCAHAIPWIIQFKEDHAAEPKPDKDVSFGFETEAGTFVNSESAATRKIEVIADQNKLKPSADRLKLYDLPKKWKSQKYYTRFSDGKGEFFDKASTFEDKIKASNAVDTPLAFSLDDIVLTDQAKHQVKLGANDKVAVFWNKFIKDAGINTSDVGIYKPDTASTASYQSDLNAGGKYYLEDYPNWTRLVITQQNMWDAFSERTEEGGANEVIGARAAVRWVDSPGSGPAAAGAPEPPRNPSNMAAGARTDKDFFTIQPFYEQRYNQTNLKYTGPGTIQQGIGRYDMAVLRCCDREDDKEVIFSFHYQRLLFNFGAAPIRPAATYMDNVCTKIAARWNGNESGAGAHNTTRTELLPQDDASRIKGYIVWFLQPVVAGANANRRAHFFIQVRAGGGRAFMASNTGYGEFGNDCDDWDPPATQYSPGSFTGAHEVGHGNSLPDEYCERWNAASWGELSFWCNVPGDPYDADGRFDPGVAASLVQNDSGMMCGVVKPRNRYYWHDAEFARLVTKIPFKVKYDDHAEYKVPPHPNAPQRQYTYWPINDAIDSRHGTRGKSDLLVYPFGKDKYVTGILPKASVANPFDGVLIVMVKMQMNFNANILSAAFGVRQLLPVLRSIVASTYNDLYMATGKVRTGSPQEWEFKKCQIRFSPRFAVVNPEVTPQRTQAQYNAQLLAMQSIGSHFSVQVQHSTTPNNSWNSPTGNALQLEVDLTRPGWQPRLQSMFRDRFAEMVGFANAAAVTPAALAPIVQKVITTNGNATNIVV